MKRETRYGSLFKKDDYTKVFNLEGTSDDELPRGFDSWKEWWEETRTEKFESCSNKECDKEAEVGAHVEKVSERDIKYIVPLCKGCNTKTRKSTSTLKKKI